MEDKIYKYEFELEHEIYDCFSCPMMVQEMIFEDFNIAQKLTGTRHITRSVSKCGIDNKVLQVAKRCAWGDCPMKVTPIIK